MLYKEYIKVESDFIPVFTSSSDRTHPERWKAFYPHESFKKILTSTVETLEKSSSTKDLPIWMNGSYGTGKTFASFVIKHILEDSLDEVEKYFAHHEITSLWQRVEGVRRKGKILVVHQSSSAGINSQNKLFNTIIESVKRALRENDCTYMGAASVHEKYLRMLRGNAARKLRSPHAESVRRQRNYQRAGGRRRHRLHFGDHSNRPRTHGKMYRTGSARKIFRRDYQG